MRFYSLDYSLTYQKDRLRFIEELLPQFEDNRLIPTPLELEQFASYILYGKDEKLLSLFDRKILYPEHRRFASYKNNADKVVSLEGLTEIVAFDERELQPLMQGGTRNHYKKINPTIQRPIYDEAGNEIDPGDGDIPGMRELWDSIDHYTYLIKLHTDKNVPYDVTQDPGISNPLSEYSIYKMRHMVINLRRNQYYLKDGYKPTLHFIHLVQPQPQQINWASNAGYYEEEEPKATKQASTAPALSDQTIFNRTAAKVTLDNPETVSPFASTITIVKEEISETTAIPILGDPKKIDKQSELSNTFNNRAFSAAQFSNNYIHFDEPPAEEVINGAKYKRIEPFQHTIDYENPEHIIAIIRLYSDLMMQLWDRPDSYGRALLFDFERYVDMACLSPLRTKILVYAIDKKPTETIVELIHQEFGIEYNKLHLIKIINHEIPNAISIAAKKHRLLCEMNATNAKFAKVCRTCGRPLPRDPLFYCVNKAKRDGFNIHCKECEKVKRLATKGEDKNDHRYKQPNN